MRLKAIYTLLRTFCNGKNSLVGFLLLGIFSPSILYGIQIATDTRIASPIYNASFDFSAETHSAPRAHVVPARFYFTATDTPQVYNLSAGDSVYVPSWQESFSTPSWGSPTTFTPPPMTYQLFTQVLQVASGSTCGFDPGSLAVARMKFSGEIEFTNYLTAGDFLNNPNYTKPIGTTASTKSLAMMQTKANLCVFWLDNTEIKATQKDKDNNFSPVEVVVNSGIYNALGLSGCTITTLDEQEYMALTYAISTTTIKILTFTENSLTPVGDDEIQLTTTSSIDPSQVAIAYNRRSQKAILTWTVAKEGFFAVYKFTPPGTFDELTGPTSIDSGFEPFFGLSIQSFANFENNLALPTTTTSTLKSYTLLDSGTLSAPSNFGNLSYSVIFPYINQGKYYAGLVSYAYGDYEFYQRELQFPDEGRWNKDDKILHLEGPPWPDTEVEIVYEFAEVATSSCLAYKANANGAHAPFNDQSGIIIDDSNLFTVIFDSNMDPSKYDSYINNQIRMLDSGNNPINIAAISSTSTSITVSPTASLTYNSNYRIVIASDVIDARGTQIWEPITLNFTTQKSVSSVLASEVNDITAWRDSAYTQPITTGGEASDSANIYLRLDAVDPAFNTKDIATVSILLNGAQIAQTTLTQQNNTSSYFDGFYKLINALATDSVYTFKAHPDSATSTNVDITYPTFSPVYPASGSANIEGLPTIKIKASEDLYQGSITAATVKLLKNSVEIAATSSYNPASQEISLTPDATLESETTYTVTLANLRDQYYNTQKKPFSYQFTIADIKPPTVDTFTPNDGETGVTIDRLLAVNFSEPLLAGTISKASVKLTRAGTPASYSVTLSSNKITIDPDDAGDGGLRPDTTYTLEITTAVTDLAGNNLATAFTLAFTTQPYSTPPSVIKTITLYKDLLLSDGWGLYEKIPASTTVYLKVTGDDGATQTRDLATATLNFSWGATAKKISLTETASNSLGIYSGSFDFGSLPLYGITTPQPATSLGSLTFSVDLEPAKAATLTVSFPDLLPAETLVNTTAGQVPAANATNVRIDSPILLSFSDQLLNAGTPLSLSISSGATTLDGTRTLSADQRKITFLPDSNFPYASKITVKATYSDDGLKSLQGNPLYREVNFSFTTQAAQTQPVSIDKIKLFRDASYSATADYDSKDDFPASGNLYIEAQGSDASPNTVDSTLVNISGNGSLRLDETAVNSGIYRGIYSYGPLADETILVVSSAVNPAASQTLILSIPSLTPSTPAADSTGVSINTKVEVKASEALDPTTVNNANIKLYRSGSEIAGSVAWNASESEIIFTPTDILATSTTHQFKINGVKDLVGNVISSELTVQFTTQGSTVPPAPPIDYLKIFSDNSYAAASELADLDSVAPGSQVYAEIKVNDLSPTTIDSTRVEQYSSSSPLNKGYTALIETTADSGIFRSAITIFNEENVQITLTSDTDPTQFVRLQTFSSPIITGISPAEGTVIYLNQEITISTSKDIAAATLSTSTVRISDVGDASYSLTLSDPRTIKAVTELIPGSPIVLKITSGLKDTDGMPFTETIANYTSVTQNFSIFEMSSNAGFTPPLADGSEIEAGQIVYLRLTGVDTKLGLVEQATATLKTSQPDSEISLTEALSGRFTGSFIVPNLPEEIATITPESRNDLEQTLKILPAFSLISYSPASGAITVPADSWPTWNFSRIVRNSDITDSNFKLTKVSDGSPVSGSLTKSSSGKQIRFQPTYLLELLTQYEMSVSAAIEDEAGHALGVSTKTRFTTQPPPAPPSQNITLANYETAEYATKTLAVAYNDSLYLELVAKDTSFSTYETARVRLDSSDGSLDGLELALVEIAPPSGVYRLTFPINLAPGTTIAVQSQANPDAAITVTARVRTTLLSTAPASGSTGLFLDTPLILNFSQAIDRNTSANGIKLLASAATPIAIDFSFADSDKSVIISPVTAYASSTRHELQISSALRDSNGLYLLPEAAWFTTRSESNASIELLTGIAPRNGQSVSQLGEATPGHLTLLATTTNMFETYLETRLVKLQTASGPIVISLTETAPGSFAGAHDLDADIVGDITATLLFSSQPALTFQLAPLPQVFSILPASGSSDIAEFPAISATFSRKLAVESTADALSIITDQGNIITTMTGPTTDSTSFSWRPLSPLPLQSTCTLQLSGLKDFLGQDFEPYQHEFVTGGRQGISLFSDNGFAQFIASDQIEIPLLFVEVAASGTLGLAGRTFDLHARSGTRATTTVKLQLVSHNTESGRYRCSIELEPGKAVPQYPLSLLPGEWLELTAPLLTDDRRIVYYKQVGSAIPLNILGVRLYSEKHFAQRVVDITANPTLFIEIEAEDRNWFTTDTTPVKVYSEVDPTGIILDLKENGTHSSQFRNFVRLSRDTSDASINNLKVLPAQRIYIESVTDPDINTRILYLPENNIKMMAVYPSPARGNSVNFRFYLNFPTYVDLKIYDTAGDEVFTAGIRGVEGENKYEWRIPRHLANGVYFYAVRIDNESGFPDGKRRARGKFAILR